MMSSAEPFLPVKRSAAAARASRSPAGASVFRANGSELEIVVAEHDQNALGWNRKGRKSELQGVGHERRFPINGRAPGPRRVCRVIPEGKSGSYPGRRRRPGKVGNCVSTPPTTSKCGARWIHRPQPADGPGVNHRMKPPANGACSDGHRPKSCRRLTFSDAFSTALPCLGHFVNRSQRLRSWLGGAIGRPRTSCTGALDAAAAGGNDGGRRETMGSIEPIYFPHHIRCVPDRACSA